MKYLYLFLLSIISTLTALAQKTLSGTVSDKAGKPVVGVSVSLANTLDGSTTDSSGKFTFTTTETGTQTLELSATGLPPQQQVINLDEIQKPLQLVLLNNSHVLQQVYITAGTIGSAEKSQQMVLETLDIVTTAGSGADPVAAMQMLPGVQRTGTQSGMMVRGGDASEAAIVVDNLVLQNPFFSDVPGVQQRSRFGAFQFKGIAFSSGGYSARYGQAMSSVLEMNTEDLPDESTVSVGVHMAGLYAAANKLFHQDRMSIEATAFYLNLKPFYGIARTNFDFYEPPTGGGGSIGYKWKTSKDGGLLKFMSNFNRNTSGILLPNPFEPGSEMSFAINNTNAFSQLSWEQPLSAKWKLKSAASYSFNDDQSSWGNFPSNLKEERAQGRLEIDWYANSRLKIWAGGEWQHIAVTRTFDSLSGSFASNLAAAYLEAEWGPFHWLSLRPGLRYEYSKLLKANTLSPRFAAVVQTSNYSQFSVASGLFYQSADKQYLIQGFRPEQQQAIHYIANYQLQKNNRTLRLETYYKSYDQLVLEQAERYDPNSYRYVTDIVNNGGYGYAGGVELFWKDKESVKNLDYWISYSYINTERLYKNFPVATTPEFISDHNLSLVGKYWIEKISMMVSGTYSYASGKPYYDPKQTVFLGNKTPDYHNLALQVSYLRSFGKWFSVFYLSVDNVLNTKNIFGYRYSIDGQNRYPIEPAMYRSIFAGVNFSLTQFDKDEL